MKAKIENQNANTSFSNLDHYVKGEIAESLFTGSIEFTRGKNLLAKGAKELKLLLTSKGHSVVDGSLTGTGAAKVEVKSMLQLHSDRRDAMLALFELDGEACYLQVHGNERVTGFDLESLKKTLKNQKDAAFKAVNRELHTIGKQLKLGRQRKVVDVTITFASWEPAEKPAPAVKTAATDTDTNDSATSESTPAVPVQQVSEDTAVAGMVAAFRSLSADNQDKLYRELQVILASRSPATGTVGKAINKAKSVQSIAIN